MQSMRIGTLVAAILAVGALLGASSWTQSVIRTHNVAIVETARALRAGLACAAERAGALPASLAGDEIPAVCRLLAGRAAIEAASAGTGLGYRRLAPNRYRICAGFLPRPGLAPLAARQPRIACVEETLPAAQPAFSPARPRKPRAAA